MHKTTGRQPHSLLNELAMLAADFVALGLLTFVVLLNLPGHYVPGVAAVVVVIASGFAAIFIWRVVRFVNAIAGRRH